jgi:glycosyltransferase involved in cell wall biosynthesis
MIKVSVIMSIYNTNLNYVKQAIASIINQSYKNFEFIIFDDGSDIDYNSIIESFRDRRIIYKKNQYNRGLAYSLNRAIDLSRGDYIARMDADDISLPNRFVEMIKFMENNKEIDIAGSYYKEIGCGHRIVVLEDKDKYIRPSMLFDNPIAHPSVFFRASSIEKYGIRYDENILPEDFNLWVSLSLSHKEIKFANVNRVLMFYRMHESQETHKKQSSFISNSINIIKRILEALEIDLSDQEAYTYKKFIKKQRLNYKESNLFVDLLKKIVQKNKKLNLYNSETLEVIILKELIKRINLIQINRYLNLSIYNKNVINSIGHLIYPIKYNFLKKF